MQTTYISKFNFTIWLLISRPKISFWTKVTRFYSWINSKQLINSTTSVGKTLVSDTFYMYTTNCLARCNSFYWTIKIIPYRFVSFLEFLANVLLCYINSSFRDLCDISVGSFHELYWSSCIWARLSNIFVVFCLSQYLLFPLFLHNSNTNFAIFNI